MGEQWRRFREKLRLCDPVGDLDGSEILPIVVGEATRWIRLDKLVQVARSLSSAPPPPPAPVITVQTINLPTGTIVATLAPVPTGWLKCNGALVARAQYSKLYAVIGNAYGKNDGVNTFALPDIKTQLTPGKSPDVSWIIAT